MNLYNNDCTIRTYVLIVQLRTISDFTRTFRTNFLTISDEKTLMRDYSYICLYSANIQINLHHLLLYKSFKFNNWDYKNIYTDSAIYEVKIFEFYFELLNWI